MDAIFPPNFSGGIISKQYGCCGKTDNVDYSNYDVIRRQHQQSHWPTGVSVSSHPPDTYQYSVGIVRVVLDQSSSRQSKVYSFGCTVLRKNVTCSQKPQTVAARFQKQSKTLQHDTMLDVTTANQHTANQHTILQT